MVTGAADVSPSGVRWRLNDMFPVRTARAVDVAVIVEAGATIAGKVVAGD